MRRRHAPSCAVVCVAAVVPLAAAAASNRSCRRVIYRNAGRAAQNAGAVAIVAAAVVSVIDGGAGVSPSVVYSNEQPLRPQPSRLFQPAAAAFRLISLISSH